MPELEEQSTFALDQIPQLLARRRWWILATACGVFLLTILVLMLLPNRYTSEATLLVIQQQVPERYVVSTSTTDLTQALEGMTQQVLSRTRLTSIIDDLGLYPKEKRRLPAEEVLERMRKDIAIQPLLENGPDRKAVSAFKISYISDNPQLAQEVTSRLTSLFIEENVKMREHQSAVTADFLREQLESVRKQLMKQEELVSSYKMQHLGELPEQEQGNVQVMASLSGQLQNTESALARAEEQRVYLESLLRGFRSLASRGVTTPGNSTATTAVDPTLPVQTEISRLQSERAALLSKYTANHPDVLHKDVEISAAQALLARLKAAPKAPEKEKADTPALTPRSDDDATMSQVRSQLEANRVERQNLAKDADRLKAQIARYQERLNSSPVREQQLASMVRDYELLKQNYADLLKKQLESGLAMSLEKHQEGQQFHLVDAPNLPVTPSSPKRLKMSGTAAGAGLALGLALAFLLETTDRSFRTEKDLLRHLKLPMVIAVPQLLTPTEERARNWKRGMEWCAGSALVLAVLAAEFLVYKRG